MPRVNKQCTTYCTQSENIYSIKYVHYIKGFEKLDEKSDKDIIFTKFDATTAKLTLEKANEGEPNSKRDDAWDTR